MIRRRRENTHADNSLKDKDCWSGNDIVEKIVQRSDAIKASLFVKWPVTYKMAYNWK